VGLRGLELRANHAVATNRSPAGAHLADFLGSNVAELPKNPPERTGNQLQKERYYRKFRAPRGALRFLPCRLDRRGGASVVRREAVINLTEDLNVKICGEAVTLKICIVRQLPDVPSTLQVPWRNLALRGRNFVADALKSALRLK
jgi:hypothetical protein